MKMLLQIPSTRMEQQSVLVLRLKESDVFTVVILEVSIHGADFWKNGNVFCFLC